MAGTNIYLYNAIVITTVVLLCMRSQVLCSSQCLSGDFDSQLQLILRQEMLSKEEAADVLSRVLADLLPTLHRRWQVYDVSLFGSFLSGLATKTSDLNIAIGLPNFNSSAGKDVLRETAKLFKKQPNLYYKPKYSSKVGLISFVHKPSRRHVELEYHSGDKSSLLSNSELIGYYFKLDKRLRPLGGFLKYWFKIHELTYAGKDSLRSYIVYLLIIFYLQQKNIVPGGYVLQLQINTKSHMTSDGWDVGFSELPFRSENTESLHQLLGGFFKYYSEFDFDQYIVSPFTGRPISRNAFTDIDNFPKEYTLNNNTRTKRCDIANAWNKKNTDINIQDIFVHDANVGELLSHEIVNKFKYLMKSVATKFETLHRKRVLAAVLDADYHYKKKCD